MTKYKITITDTAEYVIRSNSEDMAKEFALEWFSERKPNVTIEEIEEQKPDITIDTTKGYPVFSFE